MKWRSVGNGQLAQITMQQISNALDCMHDAQAVLGGGGRMNNRKYVLRRLTPIECLRLQGYPDSWCELSEIKDLTDEQVEFWESIRKTNADIQGAQYKPIGKARIVKWLNSLGSDSSIYKAAGNSLAIPCAADVLGRIVRFVEQEEKQGESQK